MEALVPVLTQASLPIIPIRVQAFEIFKDRYCTDKETPNQSTFSNKAYDNTSLPKFQNELTVLFSNTNYQLFV